MTDEKLNKLSMQEKLVCRYENRGGGNYCIIDSYKNEIFKGDVELMAATLTHIINKMGEVPIGYRFLTNEALIERLVKEREFRKELEHNPKIEQLEKSLREKTGEISQMYADKNELQIEVNRLNALLSKQAFNPNVEQYLNNTIHMAEIALDSYKRGYAPPQWGCAAPAPPPVIPKPPYYYRPISDLEFSVRVSNIFKNAGVELVGDILDKTDSELLLLPNFGRRSLNEVKEVLKHFGYK